MNTENENDTLPRINNPVVHESPSTLHADVSSSAKHATFPNPNLFIPNLLPQFNPFFQNPNTFLQLQQLFQNLNLPVQLNHEHTAFQAPYQNEYNNNDSNNSFPQQHVKVENEMAEKVDQAAKSAWKDLLKSKENVSAWRVSQAALLAVNAGSWESLGFPMQEGPSLKSIMVTEEKINAFIHCFVAARKITKLYDLEVAICESEGVKKFEELELGPLVKHPLAVHYFSLTSKVTEENILYCRQESDSLSIFLELSCLLFDGTPELHFANFLQMIKTMAESGATEEQIESFIMNIQKVPKLPDEEESIWSLQSASSLVENYAAPIASGSGKVEGLSNLQSKCKPNEFKVDVNSTAPGAVLVGVEVPELQPNLLSNLEASNLNALLTGRLGEHVAFKYFMEGEIGDRSVKCVNETNETGLPYDILLEGDHNTTEYIEVKATRYGSKNWFLISIREWQFAIEKGESFSIAHVDGVQKPSQIVSAGFGSKTVELSVGVSKWIVSIRQFLNRYV
ncbi:hypothetical protein SASPL_113381 [Salvia splendens]|uniref:Protein NO VEIN C-terminal domain-containing protein n=1 Tax=Salvia splendens TaxID=180675 RepID=A0A8X8ZZR0_SALSN|nr:hypothetical protein SASPL_113381 [Salvia splendens]